MKEQMEPEALPELNLYNFEDEEHVGSKYVLTSPRSLEACDMLSIKPMELLYKPLSDFQEEMKKKGLAFHDAYTEYDHYEKDRQRKLRECRDYRDKMIRDMMFKPTDIVDVVEPDNVIDIQPSKSLPLVNGDSNLALLANGDGKVAEPQIGVKKDEDSWRTYPPYSERHLSKHLSRPRPAVNGLSHTSLLSSRPAGQLPRSSYSSHTDVKLSASQPKYKSNFMRRQMQLEARGDFSSSNQMRGDSYSTNQMRGDSRLTNKIRGEAIPANQVFSKSLPTTRDEDVYMQSYAQHRRSYTTDPYRSKLHRTSTPFDFAAGRDSAIDRAFTGVSNVDPSSPRYGLEQPKQTIRSRTRSANANLAHEISRLKQIQLSNGYHDLNQTGRSLSLTDLANYVEADHRRPLLSTDRYHSRGYSSDHEHTPYQQYKHLRMANTEDLVVRALDRRQRELEEDLKREELDYKNRIDHLRRGLDNMDVQEDYFDCEVDELQHNMIDNRWKQYYIHNPTYYNQDSTTPKYYRENLAEKAQRERRVELEKQIAEAEYELKLAKQRSRNSRLSSNSWKRAFNTALAINKEKWRQTETNDEFRDEFPLTNEELNGYEHIAEVLNKNLKYSDSKRSPNKYRDVNSNDSMADNMADDTEFNRLRLGLVRDEPVLTEEAIRRHNILNSSNEDPVNGDAEIIEDYVNENRRKPRLSSRYKQREEVEPDDYIRRPTKPRAYDHKRGHDYNGVAEDRVKELKTALEERRRKLNNKLKETARQTEELRAARLESERKERLRQQEKVTKRAMRERSSNRRKTKHESNTTRPRGLLTEKVRPIKSQPPNDTHQSRLYNQDTFDKKVLRAELNNWVTTGQRSRTRTRSANRNESQFTLA